MYPHTHHQTNQPILDVTHLNFRYNGRNALEEITFHLHEGERVAVVGPNGAGKSTLLLTLAQLLKPARGEIRFDGTSLRELNELEYRRKISFVFQSPLLLDMTVEENVGLGLKFRGAAKEQVKAEAAKWMKSLGVESLSTRRASQLSGGEAQRVSLARAFVLNPELLLLDEPFAALDPPTRAKMLEDLSVLLAEDHRTAVFVTHNLNEAAKLSHRIAVMVNGMVRQVGTAKQIKSKPADETVRQFLSELSQ